MARISNETVYNRSVPYNVEAEIYLLGSILIDQSIIDSAIGKLNDFDFYDERNQKVFKAMLNLHDAKKNITILTVIEELKKLNYPDIAGMNDYLIELVDSVPSTASVNQYLRLVEDKAIERKMLKTMQDLCDDILNHKYDVDEMLDRVDVNTKNIIKMRKTSEFVTLGDAANEVYDKIKSYTGVNKELTGLDTGYAGFNKASLGLQKGDLMILAARPAVGKSSFALNLALNVAQRNNANVAFFSLEMSIDQILMRVYSLKAGLELGKIRSGNLKPDELLLLGITRDEIQNTHLYFDVNPSSNFADIRMKCRQLKQAGTLDFIVIDYLQLITTANSKGSRQEEVSQISRQLKTLAQELEVPILALSQLSRSVEGREDKRPVLSDLRESGSIEQDADMVMFIYRRSDVEGKSTADMLNDEVNEISQKPVNDDDMKEVVLSILKNRQGPLKDFDFHFYGAKCRFVEQKEFKPIVLKQKNNGMRRLNKE